MGINDKTQIVGKYALNPNIPNDDHAFLWQNNGFIDLGSLGGGGSIAYAINNAGTVVGSSQTPDLNTRAFVWNDANHNGISDPGEMVQLSDYGLSSAAYNVDQAGAIEGFALKPNFHREASIWINGVRTALANIAGDTDAEAWAR